MRTTRVGGREFRVWESSAGKRWAVAELDANGFMLQMAHSLASESEADAVIDRWTQPTEGTDG